MRDTPGVDMSTGSLGQGISVAVGMALAAKLWGDSYRVYALLGDGELEEGQVWEAAMLAGNHGLDNLCLIVDNNRLQIDGTIEEVNSAEPIGDKFRAFRIHVIDVQRLRPAACRLRRGARDQGRPQLYRCAYDEGQGGLVHGEPGGMARQGSR